MRVLLLLLALTRTASAAFPDEGRWSVATSWADGWPAEWHHASPVTTEKSGDWTIHEGKLDLPGGTLLLRDAERTRRDHLTEVRRR